MLAAALLSFAALAFIYLLALRAGACADTPRGLWLSIADGDYRMTGRAPPGAGGIAVIVAVDHWGYPRNGVCNDALLWPGGWTDVAVAVYRSPLSSLRRGTVLVRPDLVAVAGTTRSRQARLSLERELRQNLVDAGLREVPILFEVAVATDPGLAAKLAGLSLRFAPQSATPPAPALAELGALVADLRVNEGTIVIAGHADDRGRVAANEVLAQQRADAICDYLVRAGIDAARIRTVGFGSRVPAASNRSDEGRAANRRVEIRLEPS